MTIVVLIYINWTGIFLLRATAGSPSVRKKETIPTPWVGVRGGDRTRSIEFRLSTWTMILGAAYVIAIFFRCNPGFTLSVLVRRVVQAD
jgi:hypothetical protein